LCAYIDPIHFNGNSGNPTTLSLLCSARWLMD
jgi:hypothetical protein